MLAVLKAGAAWVPLDPGFPADRIAYIVCDAAASACCRSRTCAPHLEQMRALVVAVDDMAARISRDDARPGSPGQSAGRPRRPLAYIIYTSGSTGGPRAWRSSTPSICNFVRVAAEVYGIRPDDRCTRA